jgi:hypothetical protein
MSATNGSNGSNKNETGVEILSKTLAEKVTIAGNAAADDQKEELSPGSYLLSIETFIYLLF